MTHRMGRSIFIIFCLILLGATGLTVGQDQDRYGPPRVFSSPQPPVDPARQALVDQLKQCRLNGDRAGEAKIWKELDPSLTFFSGSPSEKPNDITVTPVAGRDEKSDMSNWTSSDIPVFTSGHHETDPEMAVFWTGTNYPEIVAVTELWNGTTTRDKIRVRPSAYHGQYWGGLGTYDIDSTNALANPHIYHISNEKVGTAPAYMGIVYERWWTSSDPDIMFTKISPDLSTYTTYSLDGTSAVTSDPDITSDRETYVDPYFYVVYYKITNIGGATPYQYDLMFTLSMDYGATWATPKSLASFTSASSSVAKKCSIDWDGDALYLAYTSADNPSISVIKSTDYGSSWSTPVVLWSGASASYVEVAAADTTHALVMFMTDWGTDHDVDYALTVDGTNWSKVIEVPHLSSFLDDEKYAVVTAYNGRYYAAYANYTANAIVTLDSAATAPSWTTALNVKNGTNAIANDPLVGSVCIIAKPGPSGTAGSLVGWSEWFGTSDTDVCCDALWQPFPIVRTPMANISFGSVNVGSQSDLTTTIYNDGNGPLTVSGITRTAGSTYFTYQTPATPFSIPAYGSQAVTVRFAPAAGGAVSATFTVSSNDPVTPTTTFTASGTGVVVAAPDINMPVTSYDFGNLSISVSKKVSLTIQNLGTATLTLSSVGFTVGDFSTTSGDITWTIPAGGTGYIKVQFTPTAAGSRSATFTIASNDPDEPSYPFTVSGTGLAFIPPLHNHAVGDFDGDGADEVALDFGTSGIYMWNAGVWSQLSANNPENMISLNIDGDAADELAVDLGSLGLWLWNGGVWSQLSVNNPEYMIAADTNNNGVEELIIDFGASTGLRWRQESGFMFGMTSADPQNIIALDIDHNGKQEVVADFDGTGLWLWEATGATWTALSTKDAISMAAVDSLGSGSQGVAAGLTGYGVWLWQSGLWAQLSGVNSDHVIAGKMIAGGGEEIAGDFGPLGLWLWHSSVWTQLSGVDGDDSIAADIDADGVDEIIGDFGTLGLWMWDNSTWTQLSGVNPQNILAGDIDGDSAKELIVDFGSLGVWVYNGATWSQVSALNPD